LILTFYTARGTTEAQGPGSLGGGSQFINAVKKLIPGTTFYAIKYPASFSSDSPNVGIKDTLRYFDTKPKECPEQLYVLSGYSQGGAVMHMAAVKMDKNLLKNRIVAAVTFGDGGQLATKQNPVYNSPVGPLPVWPEELDGRIKFNCVPGDPVSYSQLDEMRCRS
jgi:cutinase